MKSFHRAVLLLIACSLSGCAGTTQHGDARLIDNSKRIVYGIPLRYWLELPPVTLARPSTTVFHVRELPKFQLGMKYYLSLRTHSAKPPPDVVVSVIFRDSHATPFFTRTYRFSELSWGRASSSFQSPLIPIRFGAGVGERNKQLENATDYDLSLTVLTPSHDLRDTLSIHAAGN